MKLYADTANMDQIDRLYSLGVISGVTTNPSLVSKEPKGDFEKLILEIANFCLPRNLSLSVEIFATEKAKMINEAVELNDILKKYSDIIRIKIPVTQDGLLAINELTNKNIKINATACYSEQQLCLASAAGSTYVSLFYCRLKQHGGDCKKVLTRSRRFIESNNLNTQIIAGSIRTQTDVSDAWEEGAHIVTTSETVINEMILHPKTDEAVNQFISDFADWKN